MKLQLQGQRLRLRIDEAELAALRAGALLENATCFGAGGEWRLGLRQGGVEHASLVPAESGGWVLAVPAALLDPYIARLPCRDGLPLSLRTGAGIHLEAVLEVDVRDSVRSRGAARRRE